MNAHLQELRVEGRIEMHGNDGYSTVSVQIGGSRSIEVPTETIPQHLRGLGTRVLVLFRQGDQPVKSPPNKAGFHYSETVIQDLPDNPELGWYPVSR